MDQYRELLDPQYSAYDIAVGYQFNAPTSTEILELLLQRELITPEVLNAYREMNLTPDEALDRYLRMMNMDTFFNQMGIKRYCCRQTFMNPDTFPIGGIGYSHQVPEMILDRQQQEARQLGMSSVPQVTPGTSLERIDLSASTDEITNQMGNVTLGSTTTGGNVVTNVFTPNPRAKLYRVGRPPKINIMPDYSREYSVIERTEVPVPQQGLSPSARGISTRPSPSSRPRLTPTATAPLSRPSPSISQGLNRPMTRPPLSSQPSMTRVSSQPSMTSAAPRQLAPTPLSTMRRSLAPRVIRSDNP